MRQYNPEDDDAERMAALAELSSAPNEDPVWAKAPGPSAAAARGIAGGLNPLAAKLGLPSGAEPIPNQVGPAPKPEPIPAYDGSPSQFDYASLLDTGNAVEQPYDLSNPPPSSEEASSDTAALGDNVTPEPAKAQPLDSESVTRPPKPQQRDGYLEALRSISAGPAPDFAGIESAMKRDRQQRGFDKLSNLIAGAVSRRAPTAADFQSDASEGADAMKLAQMKGQYGDKKTALQLALAKAMQSKGPPGKTPEELRHLTSLANKEDAEAEVARLNSQEKRDARTAKEKAAEEEKALKEASAGDLRGIILKHPKAKAMGFDEDAVKHLNHEDAAAVISMLNSKGAAAGGAGKTHVAKAGDYDAVPEDIRGTVRAIVEGRAPAPAPGSRFGAKVLNYVTQIDPDFDSTKYGQYEGAVKGLAKSKDVPALSTARHHLQQAADQIPANWDSKMLNRVKNNVINGLGGDGLTGFESTVAAAAAEIAKAYGADDAHSREQVLKLFDSAQSPDQLRKVMKTFDGLLQGKQSGMEEAVNRVAPKGHEVHLGGGHEMPKAEKKTPGGKPYASKKYSAKTRRTYFVAADGKTVVESADGQL